MYVVVEDLELTLLADSIMPQSVTVCISHKTPKYNRDDLLLFRYKSSKYTQESIVS